MVRPSRSLIRSPLRSWKPNARFNQSMAVTGSSYATIGTIVGMSFGSSCAISFPRGAKANRVKNPFQGGRRIALDGHHQTPSDSLEHVSNPADALHNRLSRRGIRETEVAFPGLAERAPRGHRDVRLLEDSFRERCALHADVDAREVVDRAPRTVRGKSIDVLEFSEHEVPSRAEFVDHRLQRGGRASGAATPAFCANAVAHVIVCSCTFTIC